MNTILNQPYLCWTLARLTAHRLIRRKSSWAMLALGLLPCLIILYWIFVAVTGRLDGQSMPYSIFVNVISIFFLNIYVPLLALFLGLGVISDEIDTKNITFTLVRPVNRISIVFGRYLGHLIVATALVVITYTCFYFTNMVFQVEQLFPKLPNLANGLFIVFFGLAAYLAVVALLGSVWKWFAILLSLLWMVFDTFFSLVDVDTLNFISIKYRMLASYWETIPMFGITLKSIEQSSALINGGYCLLFAFMACVLMAVRLGSFEIVLSDSAN